MEIFMTNLIGTLNEKPLHADLKKWYAKPDDRIEEQVDGFTVDIVRGDMLIEIQTGNLSGIRSKLTKLAVRHTVRLVYPVSRELWIVRQSGNGKRTFGRRKSPKRGSADSFFEEFVSVAPLLAHPNFSFHVLFIQEELVRRPGGARSWRNKGWSTHERRLLQVLSSRLFEEPHDMLEFLPDSISGPFTTADLAETAGRPVWFAQKMAYCLRTMGAIEAIGKRGRRILYSRTGV